jgi:phosphate starvation-inducible PhoH-like protein
MTKFKNLNLIDNREVVEEFSKKTKDFIFDKKKYAETLLKKINVKCKNQRQKDFLHLIDENEITICIGDSGVGKSYLSIAKALELYKTGKYEKIFIITPIVESEEQIGFLKGDLDAKTLPYLFSIYYLVDKIVGEDVRKKLVENEIICPLYMSYIRGINICDSLLIGDECQNLSIRAMKTLLTRIGYNSKFILSGDINQIDRFKNPDESGLKYAYENLKGIRGIGFMEFGKEDIVRNPIIGNILDKFNFGKK